MRKLVAAIAFGSAFSAASPIPTGGPFSPLLVNIGAAYAAVSDPRLHDRDDQKSTKSERQ